jgi:hypothetical protein
MTRTEPTWKRLDALFIGVRDQLKNLQLECVEVSPREMHDAIKTTLWHLWYGDPSSVVSKAREVAKGYGLQFKIDVAVDGRDRVTFTRINERVIA